MAIAAAPWMPLCMEPEELAEWQEMNLRSGGYRTERPCTDCPLGYAAEMRAVGRCNGTPGWVAEEGPVEAIRPQLHAVGREMPVTAVLPCPRCAHRPVCSIRPVMEARLESLPVTLPVLDPAVTVALSAEVSCGHFLKMPGVKAASVAPPADGSGRGKYQRTPEHTARIAEANRRRAAEKRAAEESE